MVYKKINRNLMKKVWRESIEDAKEILQVQNVTESNFGPILGLASHLSGSRIPSPVMLVEMEMRKRRS